MNILSYLKQKGLRRAFQVIYQYKLPNLLCKIVLPFVKNKPLKETILIESHNDFDCNGGAFYDFLIRNGYNHRYKIVWLLKNRRPKDRLPKNVQTLHLYRPSLRVAYHTCTAKYLSADNLITQKRRTDQLSLYCDHGAVGLKSVKGVSFIPDNVDYILSPSENYSPILAREYSLSDGVKRLVPLGYPHDDVLFTDAPGDLHKITNKQYNKVFLWMPTFRKGGGYQRNDSAAEQPYGIPLVEAEEDLRKIQAFLEKSNCLLIIKIHPMQDPSTLVRLHGSENIRVLTGQTIKELGVDNYRLLKDADALISDYSSSAYSFLHLNRPLAFVLSDLKDYKLGLSVDNPEDFLVGHRVYTFDDFFGFLEDVCNGQDEYRVRREELAAWIYKHQDGNSCARIVQLMGLEK